MTYPSTLEHLRVAAGRFGSFDEEEELDLAVALELVGSFGPVRSEDQAHRRAAWFCTICVRRYLDAWAGIGCEGSGPQDAIDAAAHWIRTGQYPADFAERCLPSVPRRGGEVVADCDAPCALSLASAASRTAYFCRTRDPIDAAAALCALRGAVLEGLEHADGVKFEEWVATTCVDEAWQLNGL